MTGLTGLTTQRRAGVIGLVVVALLVLMAMNASRLPFIGAGGTTVSAQFTDSGGIRPGDRVEVAGIDVGAVEELTMGRGHVEVAFTVADEIRLGTRTRAAIKVSNVLGSKIIEVTPQGSGRLDEVIPVSRTSPAYDLTTALGELTTTVGTIDTARLEKALETMSTTFDGTGGDVRAALRGLSQVSRAIAARDTEVGQLLERGNQLSRTLAGSRQDIAALLRDAGALLAELDRRRESLHGLIVHTRQLGTQLRGLVRDNQRQIGPALDSLARVTAQLEDRQRALRATLRNVAVFARVFVNTIGGGPWFDSYIGNSPNSLKLEDPR